MLFQQDWLAVVVLFPIDRHSTYSNTDKQYNKMTLVLYYGYTIQERNKLTSDELNR